uniref:Uncharacterized protein n=1 Tax=Panagrolaimus superbus TaxID=310955 RepID=A0A914ZAJ7_9BILA
MDSNLQWVESNLQKQRKILEEKQKQRRLQSAGPVRATFNSPFNSGNSSSINSNSPIPTAPIVYRHAEDLVSHSISTNPPGSLSLSSEPFNDFESFSTSTTNNFSTSMTTIPSRTPPNHQSSPINETKTIVTNPNESHIPPINSTKLMSYSDNEKAESESDADVGVQPWGEEAKLDEAVLEDCSKIDVTKALEDLRPFVNAPVTRGYMMRCNITRDKKGVEKGWYPAYYLHWDRGNDRRV